jgi:hypothetical protein
MFRVQISRFLNSFLIEEIAADPDASFRRLSLSPDGRHGFSDVFSGGVNGEA